MASERLNLPDRIIVTGAAGGIGACLTRRLAAAGAEVLATDRCADPGGTGAARWICADLSGSGGRDTLARAATDWCADGGGRLGGLVHVAGIIDGTDWDAIDEAEIDRLLGVNLKAPFFLIRSLLPLFSADASIVLLGSIAALRASPKTPFYAASKAALRNLGASMAIALQPRGVRVNVVAPGLIDTPLTDGLNRRLADERGATVADVAAERSAAIPAGRAGTPDEVAAACLFLLSPAASYCNGITLHPTGGVMAGSV